MNTFEFNNKYHRQLHRKAIGTRITPSYANLFMGSEQKFLQKAPYQPLVWWRYIDDILMIWTDGTEERQEFIDFINQQHQTIKFTYGVSNSNLPFLSIMVLIDNVRISTTLTLKKPGGGGGAHSATPPGFPK